jgi:hypothetical protein
VRSALLLNLYGGHLMLTDGMGRVTLKEFFTKIDLIRQLLANMSYSVYRVNPTRS